MDIELEEKLLKKYKYIVGIDEVGRGCLAGPLVMVGFVVRIEDIEKYRNSALLQLVKDSKVLSKIKREKIYPELIKFPHYISQVDNIFIDKQGITASLKYCTDEISRNTLKDYKNEGTIFLLDGNFNPNLELNLLTIIDGDAKHFSISSASIIAKVYRDNLMKNISTKYPEYDLINNVGYGTKKHMSAIKKFGITKIHRKSFIHLMGT